MSLGLYGGRGSLKTFLNFVSGPGSTVAPSQNNPCPAPTLPKTHLRVCVSFEKDLVHALHQKEMLTCLREKRGSFNCVLLINFSGFATRSDYILKTRGTIFTVVCILQGRVPLRWAGAILSPRTGLAYTALTTYQEFKT